MNLVLHTGPTDILTLIIVVSVIVVGIVFIFSQVRKGDMNVLRQANIDLRSTLSDNQKRIISLETEVKSLITKVDDLENKNRTMEDLVIVALKQYFLENPSVAASMKDLIQK